MKFLRVIFCLVGVLILNTGISFGIALNSTASGNWDNPSTWSPASVPSATDVVVIGAGQTVTVNSDQTIQSLTVSAGGTLTWLPGVTLTINGAVTVNGTVLMNGGNISLPNSNTSFVLGANSFFTWQPGTNTALGATLFTNGNENFSPTSTLTIKKWYNYTVPLGSVVAGNFGNLVLNSPSISNTIVEWNQNNYFQNHRIQGSLTVDQGWITLDKSGSISNTTIGSIVLASINSSFYGHNGTHPSSFSVSTGSVTNNGGIFYGLNDGNGNVTVTVANNFTNIGNVKIINNSGVAGVSNGNATFIVGGIFLQNTGDTRIVYNVTTLNSGTYSCNFGSLLLNGGIFMGQTGCHTAGGTGSITVSNNFTVNFSLASSKFRGTSLSSIGSTMNNLKFRLSVGGNLSISGIVTSEFTGSASLGAETIIINGDLQVSGTTTSFNYGAASASHALSMTIGGNVLITGGTSFISRNPGTAGVSITGSLIVTSGNIIMKGDSGTTNILLGGTFNQSGGNFYLHNNTAVATFNTVVLTVNGDFIQSNGTLNFDNNSSSTSATHTINVAGPSYSVSGSGLITHSGAQSIPVFGQLNFTRNGIVNYSRSGNNHFIQQIKQTVASGCTLNVQTGNIQIASHSNPSTDYFRIASGGIAAVNFGQLVSNGLSGNCGVQIDSLGVIKTFRVKGLYDGTSNACINASNNINFYLHAYSVVEYNGADNQVITGTGAGIATTSNHMYGILRINFNGTDNAEYTAPASSNVFVRTRLDLVHGELNLNSYTLTILSGIPSAITRTGGYVKSEMNAATNTSILLWKNMTSGLHEFPFGVDASSYIPVDFTPTSGFGGDVAVSTRSTFASDNQPYPSGIPVTQTISINMGGNIYDDNYTIDRWWSITANGFTANVSLAFRNVENTLPASNSNGSLGIIQWNRTIWNYPIGGRTGSTANTSTVFATGVTLFSSWTIISNSNPLPIGLEFFNATQNRKEVNIQWATSTEINNDHFNIERSADGGNFQSIQQLAGAGNSTISLHYGAVDKNPIEGTSYYRLKQTDYDGRFTYSEIKSVNMHAMISGNISVDDFGPNPFDQSFWVAYHIDKKGPVNFQLTTMDGRIVRTEEKISEEGSNRYEFTDESGLKSGVYLLNILYNDKKITKKFIKK